jgi:large subunit ribosomal protein L14e
LLLGLRQSEQALIDGPGITRAVVQYSSVYLTPFLAPKLTRGARTPTVTKVWQAAQIDDKWAKSAWAQKLAQKSRKADLSDFDRFQVRKLKAQRNREVGKGLKKKTKA